MLGQSSTGRFGEPEEIAEVVVFLAGEGAGGATGKIVTVDGVKVMQ